MFEAYFAYKQQPSSDTESAEQYTTLSPFRLKDFYDDGGNLHTIRSDDDLFMMYFQSLYANGDREHAKQAYTEYFHLTDNHMTYRYFLTYLLRDKNTPAEDRLWAEEQAAALIRVIREEEAAYLENPALFPDSPYQIHGHAQIAVQDLEMCFA